MPHHVFVVMPFGEKEGIDFNRVYAELIRPALEQVGLEVFRADEELRPGDIRADMFQELLMADLVVADLSIDNPNAWYELGVRHGLRARGVLQIRGSERRLPFDVCVDRTLKYHLRGAGPDPERLAADRAALGEVALVTLRAAPGRRISPVYQYLPSLREPDWKSLRVAGADEFWRHYEEWARLVEIARRRNRPGDILVLADEAPTNALRLEGYRTAGEALRSLGQHAFALEQFEKALALDPDDLKSAQQKAVALGRLGRPVQAKELLKALLERHPRSAESWSLLGRIEKDAWQASWRGEGKASAAMREDAAFDEASLGEAIQAYRQGFLLEPAHYYSGINALTLCHLQRHLSGRCAYDAELAAMAGSIRWAITSELVREAVERENYWARVTLADLELLVAEADIVERAYKYAVAGAQGDWFALDGTRQQLQLLRDLEFRSEQVAAALKVLERAIERLQRPVSTWRPRQVFLFSGHMIDAPDRDTPRFPPAGEAQASKAIGDLLTQLDAGAQDLALCGGACGGDLLFAEDCLARGLRLELRLPFELPAFLRKSVAFAGEDWVERFHRVKDHPATATYVLPAELGPTPERRSAYERDNLWQLYSAIAWGAERLHFICLWDGQGGDGPGGTRHMHEAVRQRAGRVHVIDINQLFVQGTGT